MVVVARLTFSLAGDPTSLATDAEIVAYIENAIEKKLGRRPDGGTWEVCGTTDLFVGHTLT